MFVNGGFGSTPAGVYANPGQFPSNSYQQANYFVDVTFTTIDESPLRVNSAKPLPGSSSVPTNSTISAVFSKPLQAGTQSISVTYQGGTTVAGATSYDPVTRRITFTPNGGLLPATDYTVTVQGTDTLGNTVSEGGSWTFRSAAPQNPEGVCPCSLFADSDVPTVLDGNDPDAVTLGVRFAPIQDGVISAIRFYKGPGNTGSHTGTLWSVNGTALATGTFQNESTQGWQTLEFDPPIPVTANTDYVASYRAEAGHYSLNVNEFASTNLSRGPLVVAFNSGSYTYGTGYPGAKSTHNYLVDVQFEPIPTSINIVTIDPPDGAVDVSRARTVDVWFSSQIQPGATLTVKNGATAIAGTTSIVGGGKSLVFTPNQSLPRNATLDATLRNVTSTDGAALPDRAWSFTTADSADVTPVETLFGSLPPEVELVNDPSAIELGTAFTASADGEVTGVRFFKGGPANGGTHTGSLWDAAGTRLATVEFTNETSSGWQQATFDTPVAVTAGTTYVVSYFAPQGNYSATSGFFDTEWTSGSLTARATANGLYYYGSAGGFPQGSFGATNYFVDAMYRTGSAGPAFAVTGRSPVADATDVARGDGVSVTFTEPLAVGYAMSVKSGGNDIAGSVAVNGAGTTLTFTPTGSYPAGATVNVVVSGLVAASGATAPNESWSFQTVPATPVTITGRTPSADATNVNRTDPVSVTFNEPITAAGQLTLRNGGSSINGSQALSGNGRTLTFTPAGTLPADTLLTAEVAGVVSTDGASLATASWTFRTAPRPTLTASMFSGLTPATASASSSRAITVGTHFTPSTNGSVTAIKFYKGSANTGTHTVSLWTAGGTRLAQATVTGETASGWQTMVLPTPVNLTAGQSYVVSYQAPVGRYSITNGFFTNTPHTVGPLSATRAQNGRYRYTTNASVFPNQISTGSNLFVDVVFSYLGP